MFLEPRGADARIQAVLDVTACDDDLNYRCAVTDGIYTGLRSTGGIRVDSHPHPLTPTPIKMSFSLSHPVNTALLLYILYLLQRIIVPSTSIPRTPPTEFKAGYSWMPRTHALSLLYTTYTPRTLEKFSGRDGGRILLAIAGTVFDVTAGRGFYGPGEHSLPQIPNRNDD